MRVFQEEIFGPVVALTTLVLPEAIEIANDTIYGLGAGVWRDVTNYFQVPKAIQAGRNQYNTYPAHAPFGGVKKSGFGRENHN
jgi:aldehyde dehydrogenase (NAD+)/aldehyde dehydrogenase